jgi:hypothetical protein
MLINRYRKGIRVNLSKAAVSMADLPSNAAKAS